MCGVATFRGVYKQEDRLRVRSRLIRCGKWGCKECGPRKAKRLYARAMASQIMEALSSQGSYAHKLLTLTLPGREWREKHTVREAYDIGSKALTGLMKYLHYHLCGMWIEGSRENGTCAWPKQEKEYSLAYLRVTELQEDGYPHWHVVLVGEAISHKSVLRLIEDYWRGVCGLGFVKLNSKYKDRGAKGAIKYVLKYIFKELGRDWGADMSGTRRYQGSREVLGPIDREGKAWIHERLTFRPAGKFLGIEYGEFCYTAVDGITDEEYESTGGYWLEELVREYGPPGRVITE